MQLVWQIISTKVHFEPFVISLAEEMLIYKEGYIKSNPDMLFM